MSQIPANVPSQFVQPVNYPTKEVLRQQTIGNLMQALGVASSLPAMAAQGIQTAEQIGQQKTAQEAGGTVEAGLQTRQLSFQEQENVHSRIQQGQANLGEIASFAQARLAQSQFLENAKITDYLKSLTPEQANALAKSPIKLHQQIAALVHTPESYMQFKTGLADQAAITDMGEVMRRYATDQSKSPTQHMQDVVQDRVNAANQGVLDPTDELFGHDQEIQHLYKASIADKTFHLELAMTQKHAEQLLANMQETSKQSFVSNIMSGLANGTLDGPKAANYISDQLRTFQESQKRINSDLGDQALDSMTYSLLSSTLKGLDPRYGKSLGDKIIASLPNSKLAQYVKGNLMTELNQNLVNLQGENFAQLTMKAGATYSPEDLRELQADAQKRLSDGLMRKSDYQRYQVEVEPAAQARVMSFIRTSNISSDSSSDLVLNKSDAPMIDLISSRRRAEDISSEPQLYANFIGHGGVDTITPSILGFINSYANSKNPQEFGHGMQIVDAMYKANPGATETLIRDKSISPKFSAAIQSYKTTGEDASSFASRKWAVPNQLFELANDVIAHPEAHNVALGDSLQTRLGNTLSKIDPIPESWRINQSLAKYLPNWTTGRPGEVPQSVQEYARNLYVDLFTDYGSRNPGVTEGDINRNIMDSWASKIKGNVAVLPFGANNTAVRLNGVGYAQGATKTNIPGLYNVTPEEAGASAGQLGIFAGRMITELSKKYNLPETAFKAEADNVAQDSKGNWVMNIRGGAPYNAVVAQVKFKDIKELIKDNEQYLDSTEGVPHEGAGSAMWNWIKKAYTEPAKLEGKGQLGMGYQQMVSGMSTATYTSGTPFVGADGQALKEKLDAAAKAKRDQVKDMNQKTFDKHVNVTGQ